MTTRYRTAFFAPSGFATSTARAATTHKAGAAVDKVRPEPTQRARRDVRTAETETEAA